MPSQELIYAFQAANSVVLDTKRLKDDITKLLTATQDNKTREERIGEYIKHEYPKIAGVFEFNKAKSTLMNRIDVPTTSSLEFFEGYVNIISEIVKETADSLTTQPYEPSMDYFGIKEKEAKNLIEEQLNAAAYMDVRRAQIATVGVTDPAFMDDLTKAFKNNASYQEASAGDKKRMQQVYATKQLMQAKLDSKKGFVGWFWKLFHRTETKAMKNYINTAERALTGANFTDEAVAETMEAMTQKGYFYDLYNKSGVANDIKAKFAKNEEKYASIRAREAEREAALNAEIDVVSKLPVKDQLFEIRFRPSSDMEKFNMQLREFNEVGKLVEKGNRDKKIPKEVLRVFSANSKKFRSMKNQQLHNADQICEDIENNLISGGDYDNYKGMKFSELKALVEQKEAISVEIDDKEKDVAVSQPVESAPTVEKDPVVKND